VSISNEITLPYKIILHYLLKTSWLNSNKDLTSPITATKEPWDTLRVTWFNTIFNACSSLLDKVQHASWINTPKPWTQSGCSLRNDDGQEFVSPSLNLCSGQARNLLNRPEDMMACSDINRNYSSQCMYKSNMFIKTMEYRRLTSINPLITQGNEFSGEIRGWTMQDKWKPAKTFFTVLDFLTLTENN